MCAAAADDGDPADCVAGAVTEREGGPSSMIGRKGDDYALWYEQDAERVIHGESYEGGYHHHRRIRVVCRLLKRLKVRSVVDMGCGDGWQANKLNLAGFQVIASDLALERLRRARHQAPGVAGFFVSDMRQPSLVTGRVDCIYLGQVLEHLPDPEGVLRHLRTAVRPGGYLVLDTPCRDNPVDDLIRFLRLDARYPKVLDWSFQLDPGHIWFFWLREIRGLLEKAGFEFVLSLGAPRLRWNSPRVGNPLAEHRWLWGLHDWVEDLLGLVPFFRTTGAVVVCVARRPLKDVS